jgi:hypothetical protein
MNGDELATGARESATALCDVTSRVAAGPHVPSSLIAAEEHRMDGHPENAACSAPRADQ